MKNNKKKEDNILKHLLNIFYAYIVVSIVGMLVINILFQSSSGFQTLWSAADALQYYGSVLGAAATIVALYYTIKFTIINQESEKALSIKPRLESSFYSRNIRDMIDDNNIMYIYINNDGIKYSKTRNFIVNNDKKIPIVKGQLQRFAMDFCLKNVGAGNAIGIEWLINGKYVVPDFSIMQNESQRFIVAFNTDLFVNDNKYQLQMKFTYSDIETKKTYKQSQTFYYTRCDDRDSDLFCPTEGFLTAPEEI